MDRLMHKALSTIQPRRVVVSVLLALMNHNCDDQYTGRVTFGTQEEWFGEHRVLTGRNME